MVAERVRYFTGLFLEEQDFRLEQLYHLQMRRRLNFGMFMPGVLYGLSVAREATDRIRVDPGMAVDSHQAEQQGREIVLSAARTVNLNAFANGAQVYITIAYGEQLTEPKPPLNIESRVSEDPVIETFLDTGAGFTQDRNLQIILARVTVGVLSAPDLSERQLAQLRLAGTGTGTTPGGPTVANLAFNNPPNQGSAVVMTINGTNLGNNPQVTILDMGNNPDAQIVSTINAGTSSNTVLVVNLAIAAGAALGPRRVRVQTDNGPVTTNPAGLTAFTVIPPAPALTNIAPLNGRQTITLLVTITGSNLAPNPVVTVLQNDNTPDPQVAVTLGTVAATSIAATLAIGAGAAPGGRRIRVQTDGGQVTSAVDFFAVRPVPVIKSLSQASQTGGLGDTIFIRGSDIRDDTLSAGSPATGTTVRFVDPGNPGNFVDGGSPTVLSNIAAGPGPQRVQVIVPAQGTLPDPVNVTLEIEGAIAVSPTQFTILP